MTAFHHAPKLPIVPPPVAGEAFSGWLVACADVYGATVPQFLAGMGITGRRHHLRWLDVDPPDLVVAQVSAFTGVSGVFIRQWMTLAGTRRELVPAVLACRPLCMTCVRDAERGIGRHIEYLHWRVPWRFFCEKHPPCFAESDFDGQLPPSAAWEGVALLQKRLEECAASPETPFPDVGASVADVVTLVRSLNRLVRIRAEKESGRPVFRIVEDVLASPDGDVLPEERRNHIALSAWYAAQVLSSPTYFLFFNTRLPSRTTAIGMFKLMFDFLPAEVILRVSRLSAFLNSDRGAMAARTHAWLPTEWTAAEEAQAKLLRGALSSVKKVHTRSPCRLSCDDLGKRFIPRRGRSASSVARLERLVPMRKKAWMPAPRDSRGGGTAPEASPEVAEPGWKPSAGEGRRRSIVDEVLQAHGSRVSAGSAKALLREACRRLRKAQAEDREPPDAKSGSQNGAKR